MIKLIILKILNINVSLIISFLKILIKFIKTFNFIIIFKKYLNYFKTIFKYLKKFKYFYIYKIFIKTIAICNILLALFTMFILMDFQYHGYLTLIKESFK